LINLPFIETVFHILNRNLPQGPKVWPPGSLDINPFDHLKCGYLGEVLTDPLTKKPVPDNHHHGGLQQGFGSGSVLDPYSIEPLDPDPDPRSKFCFVSSQKSFTLTQSTTQTTFQVGVFLWGMNVGLVI